MTYTKGGGSVIITAPLTKNKEVFCRGCTIGLTFYFYSLN